MKRTIQSVTFLCLVSLASQVLAFTKVLTARELQTHLASEFPVEEQTPFMTLTLSDPRVILADRSDRIGVELTVSTSALGNVEGKARGLMDGKLHYESNTGEFFLLDPQVRRLRVAGVAQQYQGDIRTLVDGIAKQALSRIPIYRLNEQDPRQSLAKTFLKSATVRDGKLVLELGLF